MNDRYKSQLEKACNWVQTHRKDYTLSLARLCDLAAWRFRVTSSDVLTAMRERLRK